MPIQWGGDYGWLATQGGVADLPVPQQVLDMEKRLMEASKAGQDTSAYWDQLRPYFESRYDPELFRANQAGYAAQQGDAQIKALGGVKITPDQLQQMKDVHAQGGIYSVLNPGLNVAPSADYSANRAAYQSQYTNPTATNAADFLASLKNFGGTPATTVNPSVKPTPTITEDVLQPGQYYGVEGRSVPPGTFDPNSPYYNPNVVRWTGEQDKDTLWSTASSTTSPSAQAPVANLGLLPPNQSATPPRDRWTPSTPTTPVSTPAPVAKLADNVARATKGQYTPPSTNYSPVASAAASSPVQSNPMGGQSAFRTSRYKSPWLRYGAGRM